MREEPIVSRTDNTDPHWVRAHWWEPKHWRCDRAPWFPYDYPCDLPDEPVITSDAGAAWRIRGHCTWVPTWDGMVAGGGWSAPPWFARTFFTCPERRRVRDELTLARQEYRATGEVDVDVVTAQHRHRADWAWW
jgi:hypothetical protein